jgi:hypothetical protein
MAKVLKVMCVVVGAWSAGEAASVVKNHTFFSFRSEFQTGMPVRVSFFRNDLLDECQGLGGAMEAVVYGGQIDREGSAKIARFFLPGGCTGCCLNVREFNPAQESNPVNTEDGSPIKDVEARHFNIRTRRQNFASRLCFSPEHKRLGIGFAYKQTLTRRCDGTTQFWFELGFPVERIQNSIRLTEAIESTGGGARQEIGLDNSPRVGTMVQAFNQRNWLFGKIDSRKHVKWGVADVELKLGYNSITCEPCTLSSYLGVVIPTGTKVRNKFVFEPVVGNNRHYGAILGNTIGFALWKKNCYNLYLYIDGVTRYLFRNHQIRSFDLIGKPWSRYMEVYRTPEDAAAAAATDNPNSGTSGINVFTRCVQVRPHLSANFNTGFVLSWQRDCASWVAEFGYNFFARQAEVVELDGNTSISTVALKGVNGAGTTTAARTIKNNFQQSVFTFAERYQALTNCDIDLESAAHPATISYTVYATLGYKWERECPFFAAIGGSYEFSVADINTTADRWLIWGKVGFTF